MFKKKLGVQILNGIGLIPTRAHDTDAGMDLYSPYNLVIQPHSFKEIDLCIAMEIPKGYGGFIYARSGLGSKHGLRPRNCVGVIDSSYRGEISITLENHGTEPYSIHRGDRIAQMVISKVELMVIREVETLSDTHRGTGGFGSTGK